MADCLPQLHLWESLSLWYSTQGKCEHSNFNNIFLQIPNGLFVFSMDFLDAKIRIILEVQNDDDGKKCCMNVHPLYVYWMYPECFLSGIPSVYVTGGHISSIEAFDLKLIFITIITYFNIKIKMLVIKHCLIILCILMLIQYYAI